MAILENIYYGWNDDLKENSEEVEKASTVLSNYEEAIRSALCDDFFKYDDAVISVISAYQKQGFMAGFEAARQLMVGGKVV